MYPPQSGVLPQTDFASLLQKILRVPPPTKPVANNPQASLSLIDQILGRQSPDGSMGTQAGPAQPQQPPMVPGAPLVPMASDVFDTNPAMGRPTPATPPPMPKWRTPAPSSLKPVTEPTPHPYIPLQPLEGLNTTPANISPAPQMDTGGMQRDAGRGALISGIIGMLLGGGAGAIAAATGAAGGVQAGAEKRLANDTNQVNANNQAQQQQFQNRQALNQGVIQQNAIANQNIEGQNRANQAQDATANQAYQADRGRIANAEDARNNLLFQIDRAASEDAHQSTGERLQAFNLAKSANLTDAQIANLYDEMRYRGPDHLAKVAQLLSDAGYKQAESVFKQRSLDLQAQEQADRRKQSADDLLYRYAALSDQQKTNAVRTAYEMSKDASGSWERAQERLTNWRSMAAQIRAGKLINGPALGADGKPVVDDFGKPVMTHKIFPATKEELARADMLDKAAANLAKSHGYTPDPSDPTGTTFLPVAKPAVPQPGGALANIFSFENY
jgi:hypothetical protein